MYYPFNNFRFYIVLKITIRIMYIIMIYFVTFCFEETESCCVKYSVISMSELVGIYGWFNVYVIYITTETKKPNALYADGSPLAGLNTHNMQTKRILENRLRQYVQRWFIWLHSGLRNRVSNTGGFNRIWLFVLKQLRI
jgi:hypothetical protein